MTSKVFVVSLFVTNQINHGRFVLTDIINE